MLSTHPTICLDKKIKRHWLKCNGMQGNAVPQLQFTAQIVAMLGKGTRPLQGAQTRSPTSNFAL